MREGMLFRDFSELLEEAAKMGYHSEINMTVSFIQKNKDNKDKILNVLLKMEEDGDLSVQNFYERELLVISYPSPIL